MRKPYLIATPNLDPTSGGIRVMYGLYGWLLAKGEIAYLDTRIDVPAIGIYPEIYRGNNMEANRVVRYILQTPGIMTNGVYSSPTTNEYQNDPQYKNDLFYVFSKIYDTIGVDDNHILFLPIINTKVFKDQGKTRNKTCYLIGKGQNKQIHPKDSIELTRQFATDQQALADLLNECEVMYCYDRLSAMMEVARLCGCRVKYYGEFPREELAKYEPGLNGIGLNGKDYMLRIKDFRNHYLSLKEEFSRKLDLMIVETQS